MDGGALWATVHGKKKKKEKWLVIDKLAFAITRSSL